MTLPRMLVVDLDGTALTGRDTLRDDDREAALELKRRGVPVTIATGRLLGGTRWVAEALEVEGGVAVMNGSSRYDVASNQLQFADVFSLADQARTRAVLDEHAVAGFLFGLDAIHVQTRDLHFTDYLRIWTPTLHTHDGAAWNDIDGTIAIGAAGDQEAIQAAHDALLQAVPHARAKMFTTFRGEAFLELRTGIQDKGTAVAAMATERGVSLEDVVAVGDWWNDLPMLQVVGHPYAMGGATPDVRATATHTLDSTTRKGGAIAELARRVWDL